MTRPTLFIDDGGVLNDNSLRQEQWARLVGEFYPPILGGTSAEWSAANKKAIVQHLFAELLNLLEASAADYRAFWRSYAVAGVNSMCNVVGVPERSEEECVDLEARASAFIIPKTRSGFPGASDTVRALHLGGYPIYSASAENSWELEVYLQGMGIRDCFRRLYGSYLVGFFKQAGPEYYERVFADAGVEPRDAIVVDDSWNAAQWAASLGARVVLVSPTPVDPAAATLVIPSLAALPSVIPSLG